MLIHTQLYMHTHAIAHSLSQFTVNWFCMQKHFVCTLKIVAFDRIALACYQVRYLVSITLYLTRRIFQFASLQSLKLFFFSSHFISMDILTFVNFYVGIPFEMLSINGDKKLYGIFKIDYYFSHVS